MPRCWPQYDTHRTKQSQDVGCGGHHWRALICECQSRKTRSGSNRHPKWRMRRHVRGWDMISEIIYRLATTRTWTNWETMWSFNPINLGFFVRTWCCSITTIVFRKERPKMCDRSPTRCAEDFWWSHNTLHHLHQVGRASLHSPLRWANRPHPQHHHQGGSKGPQSACQLSWMLSSFLGHHRLCKITN